MDNRNDWMQTLRNHIHENPVRSGALLAGGGCATYAAGLAAQTVGQIMSQVGIWTVAGGAIICVYARFGGGTEAQKARRMKIGLQTAGVGAGLIVGGAVLQGGAPLLRAVGAIAAVAGVGISTYGAVKHLKRRLRPEYCTA